MTIIDSRTGRPAFIGPGGEAALAPGDPRIEQWGAQHWTMPDGRVAYYSPGHLTSQHNRNLLAGYDANTGTSDRGGAGGSGSSGSGTPHDATHTILVRDNNGTHWVVSFHGGGGGTRQRVQPNQLNDVIDLLGQPRTHIDQIPAHIRQAQVARFGDMGGAISLDVRLGFTQAADYNPDAARAEDDARESDQRAAHAIIAETLDRYGLGSLSDWAWQQVQAGRSSPEIMLELRQQPAFRERFQAIEIRQQYGLTPVSPEEIINYEQTARDLMRASGLPGGFYDSPDDFANLIGRGVSLTSLNDRITQTWDRVVNAPDEVRGAWASIYGTASDQALAAFIFDPDNSEVRLREMARTAVAGGAMSVFGFGVDAAAAARVAGMDLQDSAVRSGFGRLAQIQAVFQETRGERNRRDLDPMREGVNAVFDAGEGAELIERRVLERQSNFAGGGGAFLSQEGLTGAGSA